MCEDAWRRAFVIWLAMRPASLLAGEREDEARLERAAWEECLSCRRRCGCFTEVAAGTC